MKRIQLSIIVGTTLLLAGLQSASNAQQPGGVNYGPAPQRAPVNMAFYPIPYEQGHYGLRSHQYTHYDHVPPQPGSYAHTPQRGQYPYLNAPLYASPQPNIPHQVGGTVISNQAFAPHEMLYPHTYHAMYGPFSYRVQGDWFVTPLGVWSNEHWKLQGTEVTVKYKSRISFFKGFFPPSGSLRLR